MIKAFNKHYRKAIDLIEDSSTSEKMEMAEKVLEWFRELPEEYVVSLALFFNEVIDDLGDDSLEKINLKMKRKKKEEERRRKKRKRRTKKRKRRIMTRRIKRIIDSNFWMQESLGYKPSAPSFQFPPSSLSKGERYSRRR
jgi:hypothetical protein